MCLLFTTRVSGPHGLWLRVSSQSHCNKGAQLQPPGLTLPQSRGGWVSRGRGGHWLLGLPWLETQGEAIPDHMAVSLRPHL